MGIVIPGIFILSFFAPGLSIRCYECTSRNHSNIHCEDPMSPALSNYEQNCMVPKEGHMGNFPANFCVKVYGTSARTGEFLMIRRCALEDMNSQCGRYKFQNDTYESGCILTCKHDGCNSGISLGSTGALFFILPLLNIHHRVD
ncbi:uncharacterized protein LOC111705565 [Eurytemora carolleeae]|uniref:uncharacterized protein LOC111705565 n=1 Tax=Eurytemora carolleeae TaxID=1294199 RepID=UPI000C76835C|nr:uncharacterized protein LOC111705565 [Eurytemora carolleeae]|eukprot:XP_023333921.1 uncharacterized protein LOC111705565 [Eurytemora affinis]